MHNFDSIIVGQGLAGTALAWQLRWRGQGLLILDRGDAVTASKVAAGLITPITGKRLALDEHFDQYFATATAFYRRVEAETQSQFFHQPGSVRIFRDEQERLRFENKRELRELVAEASLDETQFHSQHGSFAISSAARLDVATYLDASRRFFAADDCFLTAGLDKRCHVAKNVIYCTGIAALRENQLPAAWFQPAKGEILTLRIPDLREDRIINRGVWLMRIGDDLYRAGATYTWNDADDAPTEAGREEIICRVAEFLKVPFEVIAHEAATRPILASRLPLIQNISPGVWAFNGLGSKGALLAPHYALQLANLILSGGCQPPVAGVARGVDTPRSAKRLTEQAHDLIRDVLKPGDTAIDATAGNGHDTLFLAHIAKHVFAFDVQPAALEATAMRLIDADLSNVTFLHCDHAVMASRIPLEWHGRIAAITFNLGYLPGGNRSITTQPDSTVRALAAAMQLLKPNGILTVMTYVAHPGGAAEDECVRNTLKDFRVKAIRGDSTASPWLYVVRR